MKADIRTIARRTYDTIETALWVCLVALVVYFVAVIAPQMPKNQAIQEAARLHAIAEEHDYYCEKWGKHAGTREHALCVLDLREFRANIERQYAEFISF